MPPERDYYDMLGLPRNASIVDIKRAYRRLIRQYHPDVVPTTPETLKKYQELTRAYEVLSDPHERVAYDRKLPKQKYPLPGLAPDALWRETSDLVLARSDRFGPLQQAMRAAVTIAREENTLVIGLSGQHQYLAGHLMTAGNRRFINDCLQDVSGEPVEFRLIEGITAEDWEVAKRSESIAARRAARPAAEAGEPAPPGGEPRRRSSAWDTLTEQLQTAWSKVTTKQMPTARARFVADAVGYLYQAEEEAIEQDEADEQIQRQLNRAIDRIASLTEVPPTAVALELLRYRRERGF